MSGKLRFWLFFWLTILVFAILSVAIPTVGRWNLEDAFSKHKPAIEHETIKRILSEASSKTLDDIEREIDDLLDVVYAPAHAGIPKYVDFHYSVLGEYTELIEIATGKMREALQERVFKDFDQRLQRAAQRLDTRFVEEYEKNLSAQKRELLNLDEDKVIIDDFSEVVFSVVLKRVKTTLPLAASSAALVGSNSVKVISLSVAKKIAAKVGAKAVAKGGSVLSGAGAGALVCAWSGPGAALCGMVGATIAWFAVDAVVINIDEYFSRDEFEAELEQILKDDRAEKHAFLVTSLNRKAIKLDEIVGEELFTLKCLSEKDGCSK